MRRRLPWVLGAIVAAGVVGVALIQRGDFDSRLSGTGVNQSNPVALGAPAQAVVVFLEPRPGDRIELLGADAVGLPAEVRPMLFLSRPVIEADGSRTIGLDLEQLAGAVIDVPATASPGPEHAVGIVAELTPQQPGTYELTGVVYQYRINGGAPGWQTVSVDWAVCADDPAPTSCEKLEADS